MATLEGYAQKGGYHRSRLLECGSKKRRFLTRSPGAEVTIQTDLVSRGRSLRDTFREVRETRYEHEWVQ